MTSPLVVHELLVDWDGTTRSDFMSEGLFSTEAKALAACKGIYANGRNGFKPNGNFRITERTVK